MNDPLTQKVIGCAIEVHRELGPGLLESAYQLCLSHELTLNRSVLEHLAQIFELDVPTPIVQDQEHRSESRITARCSPHNLEKDLPR